MKLVDKALKNPLPLAAGVVLVLVAVYFLARKTLTDAAAAVGGLVSGDNALTKGTDYEGKGAAGTLGAAVDSATGGFTSWIGGGIGGAAATLRDWATTDAADENLFYTVKFPDGSKHAVGSLSVARDGTFTYQDVRYKLFIDSTGAKVAQRL